jgi:CRP-like cAMP-binding protein
MTALNALTGSRRSDNRSGRARPSDHRREVITVGVVFFLFVVLAIYAITRERRASRQIVATAESFLGAGERMPPKPIVSTRAAELTMVRPTAERLTAMTPPMPDASAPTPSPDRIPEPAAEPRKTRALSALPVGVPACLALLTEADQAELMKAAVTRSYRAGEEIVNESEDSRAFCMLLSGRVGLLTVVGDNKRLLAGTVKPGRIFAWSGLVSSHVVATTAHAMEDSTVAVFRMEDVSHLCADHPDLGYHLMKEVADAIADRLYEDDVRLSGLLGPGLAPKE